MLLEYEDSNSLYSSAGKVQLSNGQNLQQVWATGENISYKTRAQVEVQSSDVIVPETTITDIKPLRLRGGVTRDDVANRTYVETQFEETSFTEGDVVLFEESFSYWSNQYVDKNSPIEYDLMLDKGVHYLSQLVVNKLFVRDDRLQLRMFASWIANEAVKFAPRAVVSCVASPVVSSYGWYVRECKIRILKSAYQPFGIHLHSNALSTSGDEDEDSNASSTSPPFEMV